MSQLESWGITTRYSPGDAFKFLIGSRCRPSGFFTQEGGTAKILNLSGPVRDRPRAKTKSFRNMGIYATSPVKTCRGSVNGGGLSGFARRLLARSDQTAPAMAMRLNCSPSARMTSRSRGRVVLSSSRHRSVSLPAACSRPLGRTVLLRQAIHPSPHERRLYAAAL